MWQLCNWGPGGGGRFILLTSCCASSSILLTHLISWVCSTSSLYNIHTNEARHQILQPIVHGESWLPANLHSLHTHLSFPFLSCDLLLGSWDGKYQPVVSVLICYFSQLVVEPIHELLQPYYLDVGSWVRTWDTSSSWYSANLFSFPVLRLVLCFSLAIKFARFWIFLYRYVFYVFSYNTFCQLYNILYIDIYFLLQINFVRFYNIVYIYIYILLCFLLQQSLPAL
jgi:hypothetical protein